MDDHILVKKARELSTEIYDALEKKALNFTIHKPEDISDLLKFDMQCLEQEELRIVILNTRNKVLKIVNLYRGTVHSSSVRIGEIFRPAIKENGSAIIVVHNHPSGDPSPSPDDLKLTKEIIQVGQLLDIQVLDHIIIALNGITSITRVFQTGSEN